jgi:hypothetical protein
LGIFGNDQRQFQGGEFSSENHLVFMQKKMAGFCPRRRKDINYPKQNPSVIQATHFYYPTPRFCAASTACDAMCSSQWLGFIRPALAGFDRPLTLRQPKSQIASLFRRGSDRCQIRFRLDGIYARYSDVPLYFVVCHKPRKRGHLRRNPNLINHDTESPANVPDEAIFGAKYTEFGLQSIQR